MAIASNSSNNQSPTSKSKISLPVAIIFTLAIVIIIRESAVLICQALGFASAGNIVGLIALFLLLMGLRFTVGLPEWLGRQWFCLFTSICGSRFTNFRIG